MKSKTRGWLVVAGAAISSIVLAGCGASNTSAASANSTSSAASSAVTTTTTVPGRAVSFDAELSQASLLTPACSTIDPTDCVTPISYGSVDVHGDLIGPMVSVGAANLYKDHPVGSLLGVFRGTLADCGTGRVLFSFIGGLTTGTWTVVEGSGSDDLASVTGSGSYVIEASGASYSGHYKGEVRCR